MDKILRINIGADGGQGTPKLVNCAALEYMVGANSAFMLY
jgi:hypothetical protein